MYDEHRHLDFMSNWNCSTVQNFAVNYKEEIVNSSYLWPKQDLGIFKNFFFTTIPLKIYTF